LQYSLILKHVNAARTHTRGYLKLINDYDKMALLERWYRFCVCVLYKRKEENEGSQGRLMKQAQICTQGPVNEGRRGRAAHVGESLEGRAREAGKRERTDSETATEVFRLLGLIRRRYDK